MIHIKKILLLLFLTICLVAASGGAESYSAYLKLGGVKGSCSNVNYPDWIDCVSVNYNIPGMPKPRQLVKGSFESEQKGNISGEIAAKTYIELSKHVDRSSGILLNYFESERPFPSLQLALCNENGDVIATINARQLKITSFNRSGRTERITVVATHVDWLLEQKTEG